MSVERGALYDRLGVDLAHRMLRRESPLRIQSASVWMLAGVMTCLIGLSACTHQANHTPAASSATAGPRSTHRPVADSTMPTNPVSKTTRARHLLDGCDQARPITTAFPGQDDLVIGPLSYAGARAYANHPIRKAGWNGGYFYKTGAQLRPGVSVTVSIADEAAQYAAIVTENAPPRGARSVTYQSCTDSDRDGYWWVGGFALWNRKSACVPIDVTTPGDPTGRRVVVSLGAGTCR